MKQEKGFGAIGVLVVLLILVALGLAGWYVWGKNHKESDKTGSTPKNSDSTSRTTEETTPDPTAGWLKYSNAEGEYSFKYPKTWVFANHLDLCAEGLVLMGANATSVGTCASENFGHMGVGSMAGDKRAEFKLNVGYINVKDGAVTANGVNGTKQTATASGQEDQEGAGGIPDGTKIVRYTFYTNDRTYTATYVQMAGYPDVLSDFDLLVTKTLKFSE